MPDTKISALPAAAALAGPEIVPLVQAGATKQSTIASMLAYMQVNVYPQVVNFAALPDPTVNTGKINIVQNTTGIIGFRKLAGMYLSDGASWNYLGLYGRSAVEIANVPAGNITSVDVQAALNELDADITSLTASILRGIGQINITTLGGAFEWVESFAAAGVTSAFKVFVDLAATLDTDENTAELLNISAISAVAGAGQITVTAAFPEPTSGPILLNWSAQ